MNFLLFLMSLTAAVLGDYDYREAPILISSNTQFTTKLSYEIIKSKPDESVVLSALSVLPPLGQLAFAAVGDTKREICEAIGLWNNRVLKRVFSQLNDVMNSLKVVELNLASRIYIAKDANLNQSFVNELTDMFITGIEKLNFQFAYQSARIINSWVQNKTNNRIQNFVEATMFEPAPRAALVSAIYFKGAWLMPFNKLLTVNEDFYVKPSKSIEVPFMEITDYFYMSSVYHMDAKILQIPFVGDATMVIVLPDYLFDIDVLIEKLNDEYTLLSELDFLHNHLVNVRIPKFRIETTTDLSILQKLNITKIFSPTEVKLNKLLYNKSDLYIGAARQKAFIEIDEKGIEATAANEYIKKRRPSGFIETEEFIADHPFVFYIMSDQLVLFNGVYRG